MDRRIGRRRLLSLAATGGIGFTAGCVTISGPYDDTPTPTPLVGEDCDPMTPEASDPPAMDAWRSRRADSQNTGTNLAGSGPPLDHSDGLESNQLVRRLEGIGLPVVRDGTLFTTDTEGISYAMDARSGAVRWEVQTGRLSGLATPALADDTVYFQTGDLKAVDATTGDLRWLTDREDFWGTPAVADDVAVGVAGDGYAGVEATCGTERWHVETRADRDTPALHEGTVYAVGGGTVYALDAVDGTERWRTDTGADQFTEPPVVVEDTVTVLAGEGVVITLDTTDGSEQWRYDLTHGGRHSPVVSSDAVYLVDGTSTRQVLRAFARPDGNELWTYEPSSSIPPPPTLASNGLYVLDSEVRVLDPGTGEVRQRSEYPEGSFPHNEVIVTGDALYTGNQSESGARLYAITAAEE